MSSKILFVIGICFFFWNCTEKENSKIEAQSSFSDYYEFSEMALLMEKMYDDLEKTKGKILQNENLGDFPAAYTKIHTAKMSADFERNEEFQHYADIYLQNLKKLHDLESNENLRKDYFNNVVNSCITCHKSESGCIGPVSRIGKLTID